MATGRRKPAGPSRSPRCTAQALPTASSSYSMYEPSWRPTCSRARSSLRHASTLFIGIFRPTLAFLGTAIWPSPWRVVVALTRGQVPDFVALDATICRQSTPHLSTPHHSCEAPLAIQLLMRSVSLLLMHFGESPTQPRGIRTLQLGAPSMIASRAL